MPIPPKIRSLLPPLLLFAATIALFLPAVSFSLVDLDDPSFITYNPVVRDGLSPANLHRAFTALNGDGCMYVPFLWLSYIADTTLFGASPNAPWGFHLTNVLLHAANAILLFFILKTAIRRPWLAFFAAAFWALHPLRVESVAWVTERKDTLSTFFAFLTILFYLKAWGCGRPPRDENSGAEPTSTRHSSLVSRHSRKGLLCFALLAFAAGLLSKPMLVTLPFLFLLLDFWPLRRFSLRDAPRTLPRLALQKWPFFLLSAGFSILTRLLQSRAITDVPLLRRLPLLPSNVFFYLSKTLWPSGLVHLYPVSLPSPTALASAILVLLALTVLAVVLLRRCPGFAVGLAAFAGLLFPVSGIVLIGSVPVADRYSYLPAIGLSLALAALLDLFLECGRPASDGGSEAKPPPPTRHSSLGTCLCTGIAAAVVLGAETIVTHRLLPVWRDTDALHHRLAAIHPAHFTVLKSRFRTTFFTDGDIPLATSLAADMFTQQPDSAISVWANVLVLALRDSSSAALDFYRANIPKYHLDEIRFLLHSSLALLAADTGNPSSALQHLDDAIRDEYHGPFLLDQFHLTAAAVCLVADLPDQALAHARLAPALPPVSSPDAFTPEIRVKTASALWCLGLYRQIVPELLAIADASPSNPALLNNVAWLLATTPASPAPPDTVLAIARRALDSSPDNPPLLDTYAAALAFAGRFDEAIAVATPLADTLRRSSAPNAPALLANVEARLSLFRQHRPYTAENTAISLILSP